MSRLSVKIKTRTGEDGSTALVGPAERWFLESGIQLPSGGVARHYRQDTRQLAAISSEISGYFASSLFMLHDLGGNSESFDAAVRAADFLADQAWDQNAGMLTVEQTAEGRSTACFFDCGIVLSALLQAWRRGRNARHREAALRLGGSMLKDFCGAPGCFHPVVKTSTKEPLAYGDWWSERPGCYQLKAAKAWLELSDEMDSIAFRDAYESLLEYALVDDTAFLNATDKLPDAMDRLHAYGYFLEGLLPVADRAEPRRALAAGIGRMSSELRRIAPVFARSDVYAQLLRLRIAANQIGLVTLNPALAEEEAATIQDFQMKSDDRRVDGGFIFGRWDRQMTPFLSPVSTAFCVQALTMWEQYKAGRLATDWCNII